MGKSGDLLRAKKQKSVVYQFTKEQLREHDKTVAYIAINANHDELMKMVNDEWDRRQKLFCSEDKFENFMQYMQYLLAVSCKILIEQFGWAYPKAWTKRTKLARFSDALVDEIEMICDDEMLDIRSYCDDVYKKYGIRFKMEQEDKMEERLK